MNVKYGNGKTEYGTGVSVELSGDEVATAIDAFLVSHGIHVSGPRTIRVNDELCDTGHIYVDPSLKSAMPSFDLAQRFMPLKLNSQRYTLVRTNPSLEATRLPSGFFFAFMARASILGKYPTLNSCIAHSSITENHCDNKKRRRRHHGNASERGEQQRDQPQNPHEARKFVHVSAPVATPILAVQAPCLLSNVALILDKASIAPCK